MRQKGFTLLELLVAMAVGGVVMAGALAAVYQVVWGTSRTNSQVVALNDVHQAALQLKKDLEMTQSADLPGGAAINLSWTDYTSFDLEENKNHTSSYVLSNGELQRTYDGTMSIAGRNITSVNFTRDPLNDRVINVAITATAGDMSPRSETLEFSVYLRGGGLSE